VFARTEELLATYASRARTSVRETVTRNLVRSASRFK